MHPSTDTPSTEPQLIVTSVGERHGGIPAADIVADLRPWFRDPHVSPAMRQMTGKDHPVIASVLGAKNAGRFVRHTFEAARALVETGRGTVHVVVACVGGRHRSPVVADQIVFLARSAGITAEVVHRDIDKDVLPPRAA